MNRHREVDCTVKFCNECIARIQEEASNSRKELGKVLNPKPISINSDVYKELMEFKTAEGRHFYADDIDRLTALIDKAISAKLKALLHAVDDEFIQLCKDVKAKPNLGNTPKSKKDNFLDGVEVMLTAVQYQVAKLSQKDER